MIALAALWRYGKAVDLQMHLGREVSMAPVDLHEPFPLRPIDLVEIVWRYRRISVRPSRQGAWPVLFRPIRPAQLVLCSKAVDRHNLSS